MDFFNEEEDMKKLDVKVLVEAGVMIALAFVLSLVEIYKAPQGGSVTPGSMIPIILFALRWGVGPGVLAGIAFGLLKMVLGGYVMSIPQAMLDYPLAFGLLGLAGLFSKDLKKGNMSGYGKITFSVFLAIAGRFICHFLAGVIFFRDGAGTQNPYIYSFIYQTTYLLPEFIISSAVLSFIWAP